MKNRKVFLSKEVYDTLRLREEHIEDGIENDPLLVGDFNNEFNRNIVKSITRFLEFLKTSDDKELDLYIKTSEKIKNYEKLYDNLYAYNVSNTFSLYFTINRRLFSGEEFKVLYLTKYYTIPDINDIKDVLNNVHEWKREYVLNETQNEIASYNGTNVVLGAAGTGKTDVAIHSYINNINLDNLNKNSLKDIAFITYSTRLCDYVDYEIDIILNDSKVKLSKNVYTTSDFFLHVLADSNIEIKGYNLINGVYSKGTSKKIVKEETLNYNLVSLNTFIKWKNEGFTGLNKTSVLNLTKLISNYGIEYPYLFYRGIYKGKIINKVSDKETLEFLEDEYKLSKQKTKTLLEVLDDYVSYTEEPSEESFSAWYKDSSKKYKETFKSLGVLGADSSLFDAFNKYYDFANPVRENKKCLDYYPLFLRETSLIEGYRGETRDNFSDEASLIYETCKAFESYVSQNNLYCDNDLAYLVTLNLETILSNGIYKNIIVDEFQDMTEREIHALIRLNYNENGTGKIHLYGDFEQTINPTFIQYENIETLFMVNQIEDYKKQILSSTYRYSDAICRTLEALRKKGKELFGTEDLSNYVPLKSNKAYSFQTSGNLILNKEIGDKMIESITASKNNNIMYIVSDTKSKDEFINKYNVPVEDVYTVSEAKGRENDFVVVYKLCTSKAQEYERIFSENLSYSRAARIFYNQLYVGITRCRTNFIQIEDDTILKTNTIASLKGLIQPLLDLNVDLFLEEMLSNKINYYFRALESFKNLDFNSVIDNLSFYAGEDYFYLKDIVKNINIYDETKGSVDVLIDFANKLKKKGKLDLARIIYIVLDKSDMLKMLDIREGKNIAYNDDIIAKIIKDNSNCLDQEDINVIEALGYFARKEEKLMKKIKSLKIEVIKRD